MTSNKIPKSLCASGIGATEPCGVSKIREGKSSGLKLRVVSGGGRAWRTTITLRPQKRGECKRTEKTTAPDLRGRNGRRASDCEWVNLPNVKSKDTRETRRAEFSHRQPKEEGYTHDLSFNATQRQILLSTKTGRWVLGGNLYTQP